MALRNFPVGPLLVLLITFLIGDVAKGADDKKKDKKKPEAGVVIDFSNWSVDYNVDDVTFQLEYKGLLDKPFNWEGGDGSDAAEFAWIFYKQREASGVKVELFDKTKVRILGCTDTRGVYHPAIKGTVTSKKLKPEQIPKVTNPKKA